jgi:hypothetical protein
MKRTAVSLICLMLAACGSGSGPNTAPHSTPHTAWCVDVARFSPEVAVTAEATSATLAAIQTARFTCIRTNYDPRVRSSGWLDKARTLGLGLVLITPYPTTDDFADPTAYTNLVTTGMRAYPGQSWELVNEPDAMPPAQYNALFEAVIPKMRAADPTATIISGGFVAVTPKTLSWLMSIQPLWALVDEIGIHPYPPPWEQVPIAALPSLLAQITTISGKPAVVTEWGLAQQDGPKPFVAGAPLDNPLSPEQAAADMTTMIATVNGTTPLFSIYEWDNADNPWGESEGFGIVGTPELSAFTTAQAHLH